jgi:hypothetical protein
MAIQQSPEKMLPLSDIYKVKQSKQISLLINVLYFSLSLSVFHIIEPILKNGKIHYDIIYLLMIVLLKFHVELIDLVKVISGHYIASKSFARQEKNILSNI